MHWPWPWPQWIFSNPWSDQPLHHPLPQGYASSSASKKIPAAITEHPRNQRKGPYPTNMLHGQTRGWPLGDTSKKSHATKLIGLSPEKFFFTDASG